MQCSAVQCSADLGWEVKEGNVKDENETEPCKNHTCKNYYAQRNFFRHYSVVRLILIDWAAGKEHQFIATICSALR